RGHALGREAAAWAIAAIAVGAAAVFALNARRASAPPVAMPTYRSAIVLPDTLRLWQADGPAKAFAISPDGRRLAFVASEPGGRAHLWVRAFDSGVAQVLAGTDGASLPFWSADSRSIGYLVQPQEQAFGTERQLMRIDAEGGQ